LVPDYCKAVFKAGPTGVPIKMTLPVDVEGHKCGSEVFFRSYDQRADTFEGIDMQWFHADEPPPEDVLQAIERANDSRFGLQCGVFTARMDHAMRAWDALDVGGVVIGDVPTVRVDRMPYGGVKDSGLGREGPAWAIDDFSELRLMVWTGDPAR
jgi:hypothetical protein